MKKLLILCVCIATLAACKKKDDDNRSKTEYLTAGKWFISSGTVSYVGMGVDTTMDLTADMEDCAKDNFIQFATDMKFITDEGATKCDDSDPQTLESGNWAFLNNESELTMVVSGDTSTFNVKTLNGTTLELTQNEIYSGVGYSYDVVFKH